jgi:hypothetical protein
VSEELGWRQRAIALAALGGAAMSRSAFVDRTGRTPSPVRMQVLVSIAVYQHDDSGTPSPGASDVAYALRLEEDAFWSVVRDLVSNDLVIYATAPEDEGSIETRDRDDDGAEDGQTEPQIRLTDAGWSMVISWLRLVEPMFHAWPPDRPDVDDAVERRRAGPSAKGQPPADRSSQQLRRPSQLAS